MHMRGSFIDRRVRGKALHITTHTHTHKQIHTYIYIGHKPPAVSGKHTPFMARGENTKKLAHKQGKARLVLLPARVHHVLAHKHIVPIGIGARRERAGRGAAANTGDKDAINATVDTVCLDADAHYGIVLGAIGENGNAVTAPHRRAGDGV